MNPFSEALMHHRMFMAGQDLQFRAENDQRAAGLRVSLADYEPVSVQDMAFGICWAVNAALELFEVTGATLSEPVFHGVQKMNIAAMTIVEEEVRKDEAADDGPDEEMVALAAHTMGEFADELKRLRQFERHVRMRAGNVSIRAATAVEEADRLWRGQHPQESPEEGNADG